MVVGLFLLLLLMLLKNKNLKIAIVWWRCSMEWWECSVRINSFEYINSDRHMRVYVYVLRIPLAHYYICNMQCEAIDDIFVWVHFNMPHWFRLFRYGLFFPSIFSFGLFFIASSSFALCVHMKSIRQELSGTDLIISDRVNECNLGNVSYFFYIFVSFDSHLIAMRNSFGLKVELIECCPVLALLYSIFFFFLLYAQ